tara:strand:- start:108 stop:377 length:270 start_codon:yes stop_codon:yes gene_type:complete
MATYTITTTDHEEKCLNYNIVGIQTWIDNAVANQILISQREIIAKNTEHCNDNGVAIGVGITAQVTQAYTLNVVKTAEQRNAESPTPGS